jgi:DNA polymerase-1
MPNEPRTLYLIDAHAQIFRAYYAIRGGMNSPVTGEPTQAVFGFAGMLLKLFRQFQPHYVVVCADSKGPTFRDDIYDQYKANREAPPEDFESQVERIFQMTKMFGIPLIAIPGAEADDIIATCTQRMLDDPNHQDVRVRIVSKDKDLEQLLTDRVTMFDIHNDETIDLDALREKKGITPAQVTDMLALMGDNIDNIPGVDGIGPKTAAKLIAEFGDIDSIYANIDKIKGKRRENLEKARQFMDISRKLVALKRDLDLDFNMDTAKVGAIDATAIQRFFKEMGFRRHQTDLERLLKDSTPPADASDNDNDGFAMSLFDGGLLRDDDAEPEDIATADAGDYSAITTQTQLDALVATLKRQTMIAVDTETIGLGHQAELCGFCLAWESGKGVYIPVALPQPDKHLDRKTVIDALRPVLEDMSIPKCGHNLKYDILVLRYAGIEMRGVAFDTMIASFLLGMPGHGLDALALSQLKRDMIPISKLIGPRPTRKGQPPQKTMDQIELDQITIYAAEDADVSLQLYELFKPRISALGMDQLAADVEMPLVEVLADMEFAGIRIDPDELDNQKARLAERIDELKVDILNRCERDFNIDSPKQLAEVLFTDLGLPVIKRTKTGPSTDIEVLEKLSELEDIDPKSAAIPALIVEYRQLTKLTSTYLTALKDAIDDKTKRVHATFHQTGAATGRLSSSGPNLQNIPIRTDVGRQIRKAFVAEPDHKLISADYSQIELRILAHLSQDKGLVDAFERDMDIHTAVAAQVFNVAAADVTSDQRGHAKTINFGIIYGVTPYGLARRIEGLDVPGAKKLIADYRSRFAGIDTFLQQCIEQAEQHGYVTTILGRRRAIDQISSRNGQIRALGERLAINSVVQGSAADLIKLAMANLHRRIGRDNLSMRLLLQIHDELVCESPVGDIETNAKIVCDEMENAMKLRVPLKVEAGVGEDWYSAK